MSSPDPTARTLWRQADRMDEARRCTARAKSTGERCKRAAAVGSKVCVKHGGGAPQVRAAAERRLADERARAAAVTLGLPREIDPYEALLEEVHRAAGVVGWLGIQVAELERLDVTALSVVTNKGDLVTVDGVNAWVRLYGEERDRLVRASRAAIDAGVSERLVRLEEAKGRMMAEVLARVFDDAELGLTEPQRHAARLVAARHLRALPEAS